MTTTHTNWTPAEIREWVERHGGNVYQIAERLAVEPSKLYSWIRGDRSLPRYVRAHMETLDRYEGSAEQGSFPTE
jgi:hypothetical protein